MKSISASDLVASLAGKTCPACAAAKRARQTFCSQCYYALPRDLQQRLYARLGNGYAEAVSAALTRLDRAIFVMPPSTPTSRPAPPKPGGEQMTMFQHGPREGMR